MDALELKCKIDLNTTENVETLGKIAALLTNLAREVNKLQLAVNYSDKDDSHIIQRDWLNVEQKPIE